MIKEGKFMSVYNKYIHDRVKLTPIPESFLITIPIKRIKEEKAV